jgi:hypothetical protein
LGEFFALKITLVRRYRGGITLAAYVAGARAKQASSATRNFIVRKTARTSTNNYDVVAGDRIAQIVVPCRK